MPETATLYRLERAALKLGMSKKQLLRYTAAMGKERSEMGSQRVYLFTDKELDAIRARKNA